jgi:hypothetical protein
VLLETDERKPEMSKKGMEMENVPFGIGGCKVKRKTYTGMTSGQDTHDTAGKTYYTKVQKLQQRQKLLKLPNSF